MRVFTCTDFKGRCLPGCVVVVAQDEHAAISFLWAELNKMGLFQPPDRQLTLVELGTDERAVRMLNDGDC